MQSLDVDEFFVKEDFEVVDDFGYVIMLIFFGVDKVEQWMVSKGVFIVC